MMEVIRGYFMYRFCGYFNARAATFLVNLSVILLWNNNQIGIYYSEQIEYL